MKKSTSRVEENNSQITIVSDDRYNGLSNLLSNHDDRFGVHIDKDKVKVFCVDFFQDDLSKFAFTGKNIVFYETDLITRCLTDEEKRWCDDTFMYSGDGMPEEVYEFTIPDTDILREMVAENTVNDVQELNAVISDLDTRNEVVTDMQTEIELLKYYENQVSIGGHVHDLKPYYKQKYEDKGRENTRELVMERYGAYVDNWSTITGVWYSELFESRYNMLDFREPKIHNPERELIALDLIGKNDVSYCRCCASTWPEIALLDVRINGYDRKLRVCEDCANRRDMFNQDDVASALDTRAKRLDEGQRRIHSEYD